MASVHLNFPLGTLFFTTNAGAFADKKQLVQFLPLAITSGFAVESDAELTTRAEVVRC